MEIPKNIIRLKPYTMKELACIYEVDYRVVSKWIGFFEEEIGIKIGRYYTVNQVRIIFTNIGYPSDMEI